MRGCWSKPSDRSGCYGTVIKMDFCTVSLHLPNVTVEDLEKNLTCYTQNTDHLQLLQNMQRTVLLQLHGEQNNQIFILHYKKFTVFIIKLCNFTLFPAQTTNLYPSTVNYKTDTDNGKVIYLICNTYNTHMHNL